MQAAHEKRAAFIEGTLSVSPDSLGVVIFPCVDGTQRLQAPNDYVASVLRNARLSTLKVNLASHGERLAPAGVRPSPETGGWIADMSARLGAVCDWVREQPETRDVPIGLFAGGDCAVAMMRLAAESPAGISAIVSRGGRLDLAERALLTRLHVPTLLIVGGLDQRLLGLHRTAFSQLRCRKKLEVIPGATHAFEEPGNQEVVARLARGWFQLHATGAPQSAFPH
ncbi:alpha/beta hydrolase [Noviherbaspirillum sp. 17J57-3]|uniref:Alpha/beta hydrolase n=2 Tax=Noviherbaspirillum galbum TaxID=2709383 RepID=A0A6B3SLW0_9BURK|nr:alpha/beta hydrolase [Noviherbaspirillum galbum]